MIKIVILIAFSAVMVAASICAPRLLTGNKFLDEFISFEMLNVLAVILTVTLASVANIHLSLNRIVRGLFKGSKAGDVLAGRVRREINQNAWLLLWLFLFATAILLFKGAFTGNTHVEALANGIALTVLLANVLTLYDIYNVVYKLVMQEGQSPALAPPPAEGNDYSA